MRTELDYLRMAFDLAATNAHDPHTQNGAVLVPKRETVVYAANCIPRELANLASRLERPAKYQWVEHAERRVIYTCAKNGIATADATIYCVWFACTDCARAIIQAGIREVVGHVVPRSRTPDRWLEQVEAGEAMLREAGVGMRWLSGRVGASIIFDGEVLKC